MKKRQEIPKMALYLLYLLKGAKAFHLSPKKIRDKTFFGCFEKVLFEHPFLGRMCYFYTFSDVKRQGISEMASKLLYLS